MASLSAWFAPGGKEAERLVAAVSQASRRPDFFGDGRMPDTMEGRLELLTLMASLALMRFESEPQARRLAQRFTDKLFRHIDSGLREAGVGDLSVPRRMRELAGRFYGRLGAYSAALKAGDETALAAAIARNTPATDFSENLAKYAVAANAAIAGKPVAALADAESWPLPNL